MIERKTEFSDCRKWRFTLWRDWSAQQQDFFTKPDPNTIGKLDQFVQFIGLNPSTADETQDDPTIRRCIDFAKQWGFGALCMTNLFAYRATEPQDMMKFSKPIGDGNTKWLVQVAKEASLIVCAWGNDGMFADRSKFVLEAFRQRDIKVVHCLKINETTGEPSHPLYLKASLTPKVYDPTINRA